MTMSSLMSPVVGGLIVTRAFSHFIVLAGLLVYQFVFHDFVNLFLSGSLYLVYSCIFLVNGIYLSLDSKYHQKRILTGSLFFLDSLGLLCLVFFLGLGGLYPALLISLFLFFAFRLYGSWWSLACFALWTSCVIFAALLWQGELVSDNREALIILINFSLAVNFLVGGLTGSLVKEFYGRIAALKERSFFDPDQADRPPSRLEPALNLSRKIKPILNSLLRGLSEEAVSREETKKSPKAENEKGSAHLDKTQLKQYERQLKQFQKFVDDFIEFAEPEKLTLKALDFNKLIQETLEELFSHSERPKDLKERLELRSSGWIKGSADHLKAALKHILINAFQALKIQNHPTITVVNYDEKDWLVLEISDNGQGMEKEDIRQAFEPLFSKRLGIRGMGLALAFKIVKSHGGSISLNSIFQKGTQAKIKLPLVPVNYSRKARLSA
ncbi:MAG: ATP-binding protein [Bdellovibrionales bacterium]|nr:ATP-binding protein [Bdellovibrionales bacterium]